jgi:hypothetical protein
MEFDTGATGALDTIGERVGCEDVGGGLVDAEDFGLRLEVVVEDELADVPGALQVLAGDAAGDVFKATFGSVEVHGGLPGQHAHETETLPVRLFAGADQFDREELDTVVGLGQRILQAPGRKVIAAKGEEVRHWLTVRQRKAWREEAGRKGDVVTGEDPSGVSQCAFFQKKLPRVEKSQVSVFEERIGEPGGEPGFALNEPKFRKLHEKIPV